MNRTHLIFLHGALGCQQHWQTISTQFEKDYVVHTPDFPGHGLAKPQPQYNNYHALTTWLNDYLNEHQIENYVLIGYSMGGYIGLSHLIQAPNPACRLLITIATKLEWSVGIASQESSKLTLENLQPILGKLAEEHPKIEITTLLKQTQDILTSIGVQPIQAIALKDNKTPIFMLLGSKDKMVQASEIMAFNKQGVQLQFEYLDEQPHLLQRMDPSVVVKSIQNILKTKIN